MVRAILDEMIMAYCCHAWGKKGSTEIFKQDSRFHGYDLK